MATIIDWVDTKSALQTQDDKVQTQSVVVNFSTKNAAANDIVQLFKIPQDAMVVEGVQTDVHTAEGGTATAHVGDEADTSGYDASVNLNSATTSVPNSTREADNYSEGRIYDTSDTIDLVCHHAMDTAVVQFSVKYVILANNP